MCGRRKSPLISNSSEAMYKVPTCEQFHEIWNKVNAHWEGPIVKAMWGRTSPITAARTAVAEYIANQMGLTLYGGAFPELLEKEAKQG